MALSWEHGALQRVMIVLPRGTSPADARRLLDLGGRLPDNVQAVDGLDHLGAGEAGCGGD
ncbi:MAG: hypothetical protein R3F59_25560 [Myxococcota bacterium]